jgi:hypothetical protein
MRDEKKESLCPFCQKPHPQKQICRERLEALAADKREGTRPYRAGTSGACTTAERRPPL